MELTKSNEDYLEAIRHLSIKHGAAQVRDIAALMKVKMPSVNSAVRNLAELGLVDYQQYAPVRLTPQGELYADQVIQKHSILREFLSHVLKLEHGRSDELACLMEHILNDDEIRKFKSLSDLLE